MLMLEKGHFYVCGDCTMAEHVYQTLKTIIQKYGAMTDGQVENYMLTLRVRQQQNFMILCFIFILLI